ncbi:MAG: hypothetical protein IPM08_13245 [Actinomycetales bacterium]|nr:hypothetical protein [Actinomycetales bacterium]
MSHLRLKATLVGLALCCLHAPPGWADVGGSYGDDGATVRMNEEETAALPTTAQVAGSTVRYVYDFRVHCDQSAAGAVENNCRAAIMACDGTNGPGPLTDVLRREVSAAGVAGPWRLIGTTCYPPASIRPQVTLTMIRNAFHLTPWAKPVVDTQPAGNVTLVNLKTYYRIVWSTDGFQPGEVNVIDPTTMLGHRVEIRPRAQSYSYNFGDGQSSGPTMSEGGVYPTGDVVHRYPKAGQYVVSVTTTWSADFRVDGGAWAPIPDSVVVPGPDTTVTVKAARGVLVNE